MDSKPLSGSKDADRKLPSNFRKLPFDERRLHVEKVFALNPSEIVVSSGSVIQNELSDLMIESSIGIMPVPLGIVTGFYVDGREHTVPIAVEEPSVVAAANYAARILMGSTEKGMETWATEPIMRTQITLQHVPDRGEERIREAEGDIRKKLNAIQRRLVHRGGGYRGMEVRRLPKSGLLVVDILIDVRNAMGANMLNTAAESIKGTLEKISGGCVLMAILTNASEDRRAGARFTLPVAKLRRAAPEGMTPVTVAERIVMASQLAQEDPKRAVTHNKGIMNGISSLALATGNDIRAVESAAHSWAARSGQTRGLSTFSMDGDYIKGQLELPLPLGTVGGAISIHPVARTTLKILGNPDAPQLARIAAALGLAQNLAAVLALVTGGIQEGHMKLHANRLAYQAGARGREVRIIAERLSEAQSYTLARAQQELAMLREEH
jgi:hydroxymethylglutaryl-CoA reductase